MSAPAGRHGRSRRSAAALASLLAAGLFAVPSVGAAPRTLEPAADSVVLERLPPRPAGPRPARAAAARGMDAKDRDAQDVDAAVLRARDYMSEAHRLGDARLAGLALGVLQPWSENDAPAAVHAVRAQARQYLHDFDGALTSLSAALSRAPTDAQSWLTLGAILRVQGRYEDAARACENARTVGQRRHGAACIAELQALAGDPDDTMKRLVAMRAEAGDDRALAWTLAVSIAELHERQGRDEAAVAAWRDALAQSSPESAGYVRIALSLALARTGSAVEAEKVLAAEPETDTAIMARALVAAARGQTSQARRWAALLRSRENEALLRPGDPGAHLREYAWVALDVERDRARALSLARRNLAVQREPVDLLIFARAAAAADPRAREEAQAAYARSGIRDRRVEAALAAR